LKKINNNVCYMFSVHAITSKISPVHNSSGLEMLETDTFKLYCFQTLTGTKFLLVTSPQLNNVDSYMKKIYDVYSDFVMKNPFHTPEMPIRSEQFDQSLLKFNNTSGAA
ncbi:MAG: synbindin, partial [Benjaminiella poitrasii]